LVAELQRINSIPIMYCETSLSYFIVFGQR
jgi:hypothetical protein